MTQLRSKKFVALATILFLSFIAYASYLEFLPDTRLESGAIGISEMYWWEFIHWFFTAFVTLCLLASAFIHAVNNKKFGWLTLMVLFFPLAFVYAWKEFDFAKIHARRLAT